MWFTFLWCCNRGGEIREIHRAHLQRLRRFVQVSNLRRSTMRKLTVISLVFLFACSSFDSFAATVTLAWDHHPDPIVAGYNIYRSTTSGGPYTKLNLMLIPQPAGTDTPMYTDTTPSNSQAFYYVVRAVSTGNIESANSNEVVWNPPPSPPT